MGNPVDGSDPGDDNQPEPGAVEREDPDAPTEPDAPTVPEQSPSPSPPEPTPDPPHPEPDDPEPAVAPSEDPPEFPPNIQEEVFARLTKIEILDAIAEMPVAELVDLLRRFKIVYALNGLSPEYRRLPVRERRAMVDAIIREQDEQWGTQE